MARMRKMPNAVSKTLFQKNANKTNSLNLPVKPSRGGYRL